MSAASEDQSFSRVTNTGDSYLPSRLYGSAAGYLFTALQCGLMFCTPYKETMMQVQIFNILFQVIFVTVTLNQLLDNAILWPDVLTALLSHIKRPRTNISHFFNSVEKLMHLTSINILPFFYLSLLSTFSITRSCAGCSDRPSFMWFNILICPPLKHNIAILLHTHTNFT